MSNKGIIFDWRGTLSDNNKQLLSFVPDLLKKLHAKYKLGLITSPSESMEERLNELKTTGIFHYFTSVIVINKETNQKKNSQTFLTCMEELGSKPDATYIVDDRTVKGIKIGNQIGCRTVRIKNGNFPHELPDEKTGKPTFIINTAEELPKILN